MAKRYGRSKYSTQQTAQIIRDELVAYAAQNGLPNEWVQAALAIVATESGFVDDAYNDGSAFNTVEQSLGPWQINLNAHGATVTPDMAMDPVYSTRWRIPGLVDGWQALGGVQAFRADPAGFQEKFQPRVQGSIPPPGGRRDAEDALAVGYSVLTTGRAQQGIPLSGEYYGPATGSRSYNPSGNGFPDAAVKPATTLDAIESLLMGQLDKALGPGGDPYAAQGLIASLQKVKELQQNPDATATVQYGGYDIPPDLAARLQQEMGLTGVQITEERNKLRSQQAWQATQNEADRAIRTAQMTGDWGLAREQLAQAQNQFLATFGLNQQQFNEGIRQWEREMGLRERSLDLEQTLGLGSLGIQQGQLDLSRELGQGNLDIARQRLAFDREDSAANRDIANRRLGIDEAASVRQQRQSELAAIVDIVGLELQNNSITIGQAEKALDTLLELYQMAPSSSGFLAGWEPGGPGQALLQQGGGTYREDNYRVRPFPIDLESMAKAGNKFDLSKSWQQARDLIGGFFGQGQGATPGPGATPTAPAQAPQAAPQTPAAPAAQATPAAAPVQQPTPEPMAPPQQPAVQSPPACPPGQHRIWDGQSYGCAPDAQTTNLPTPAPAAPPVQGQ